MTRHEAYVEKGWEEMGLAHLFVSRIREDGSADFAMFLVDLFCLGVKDASFEADVGERYLKELVEERLPEDYRERIHPACAKKLIEGALAYAESLGFTPHRDFRKARKVLNGIDASAAPGSSPSAATAGPAMCAGPTTRRIGSIASAPSWRPAVASMVSTTRIRGRMMAGIRWKYVRI